MRVEIDSLVVDKDREVLTYGYRVIDDNGNVTTDSAFSLDGEEYLQAQEGVNRLANETAQAQANENKPIALDIFDLIETALELGAKGRLSIG